MKTSFNGLGQEYVTFQTAATAADEGKVCKAADGGSAEVCDAGDGFFGVLAGVRGGAACVQTKGYVELPYTGTAPTVGWCALAADGTGGVKALAGAHEFLVVSVDTENTSLGMWL